MSNRQHSNTFVAFVDLKNDTKRAQNVSKELKLGIKRALLGFAEVDWKEFGYSGAKRSGT